MVGVIHNQDTVMKKAMAVFQIVVSMVIDLIFYYENVGGFRANSFHHE